MLDRISHVESLLDNQAWVDKQNWQSLKINYHPPFVDRLWCQYGNERIFIHKLEPCKAEEALYHPHTWPSAVKLYRGKYVMKLGHGSMLPPIASTQILVAGSSYEMLDPLGWHSVQPLTTVFSLMVTGTPWENAIQYAEAKPTNPLQPLSISQVITLMDEFQGARKLLRKHH